MAYRSTTVQPLGTTALTTSIVEAWDPGAARALLVYGAELVQITADADPLVLHFTDGTTAAAGTIATLTLGAGESPNPASFGAGKALTKGNSLGIKTDSGGGTVAGFLTGQYVY